MRRIAFATFVALGLLAAALPFAAGAQDAAPGGGAEHGQCYSRQEQRDLVLQGFAIRLGLAMRAIDARDGDELLRADLCRSTSGPVYVLTLLARSGKVSRAIVNARSGAVIKAR